MKKRIIYIILLILYSTHLNSKSTFNTYPLSINDMINLEAKTGDTVILKEH